MPNPILRLFHKLRFLARREKFDADLAEEMAYHRELKQRDLQSADPALSPQEARYAISREFGNDLHLRDRSRDIVGFWFETTLQDFRFSLRQLRKNLGFTVTAILMLALGIAASVSIFAFTDAALLKPLPYKDPNRLVSVFERVALFEHSNLSIPDYLDWKKRNNAFTTLEAYRGNLVMLQGKEGVESVGAGRVSDGFFRVLGVTPVLGRDFATGEDVLSAPRTAMLAYLTWLKRYNSDPNVIGQSVTIDGNPHTIIGVLPPEFHFVPVEPAEYWITLHPEGQCDLRRGCHGIYGVARLKDGVTLQQAQADTASIAAQLEKEYPDSNRGQASNVVPLSQYIVGDVKPIMLMLLGGAGLLLAIAAINIASLVLVRTESRRRELAVRGALGASPIRLIRQFVTEALVLVGTGSILGLAFAYWTTRLLAHLVPADLLAHMAFWQNLSFSPRVFAFAALLAFLAAILFSLTPTVRTSLPEVRDGLAEGSRGSANNTWRRLGSKLVVLELATAVILLVIAGLLGKSLYRLLRVDVGFQPDHIATLFVAAPNATYAKEDQALALHRLMLDKLRPIPGVKAVGVSSALPIDGWGNTTWFRVLGRPWNGEHEEVAERDVSTDYFTVLGAKLVRGRYFNDNDQKSTPRVVIINRAFEKKYFPGEDALTKQISFLSTPPVPIQIVGVVEDIKEGQLDSGTYPALYFSFLQGPDNYFMLAVRTSQAETSVIPSLVEAIRQIDPAIAATRGASMNTLINNSPAAYIHRSSAWLVGGFAALALILSVVGLYGVIAYSVSQRTREIGVRMALGAQRSSVYQLVLGEAGRLALIGIAAGLLLAVGAAVSMRSLLFGVRSWDLTTLIGVSVVLAVAALLASYIPAHRAATVDPVVALRTE
ncbi:MAG TPA: ABC transporter permease [Candidatus Sulfotelmatobacter sp.]|nr:ABC transporter permease [Candidatus Sulfotelmatobacter sp.]